MLTVQLVERVHVAFTAVSSIHDNRGRGSLPVTGWDVADDTPCGAEVRSECASGERARTALLDSFEGSPQGWHAHEPHRPLPHFRWYLLRRVVAPSSQGLEPPTFPGRFMDWIRGQDQFSASRRSWTGAEPSIRT